MVLPSPPEASVLRCGGFHCFSDISMAEFKALNGVACPAVSTKSPLYEKVTYQIHCPSSLLVKCLALQTPLKLSPSLSINSCIIRRPLSLVLASVLDPVLDPVPV